MKKLLLTLLTTCTVSLQAITKEEVVSVLVKQNQATLATLFQKSIRYPNGFYVGTDFVSEEQAAIIRETIKAQRIIIKRHSTISSTPAIEG